MNTIRRERIREFIEKQQIVTIKQLGALMPDVSLMTLHRDLNVLQEQGYVEKVRGGARYLGSAADKEPSYAMRARVNKEAKATIAQKALGLLEGVESIFLDSGTTTLALARVMPDRKMNVVTNGPHVAIELAKREHFVVTLCGGLLSHGNLTLSGSQAIDCVSSINIDLALLVASGYSEQAGFTCSAESEAEMKRKILKKARHTVVLMDSSKIGRILPYTYAMPDEMGSVVTELEPDRLEPALRELAQKPFRR